MLFGVVTSTYLNSDAEHRQGCSEQVWPPKYRNCLMCPSICGYLGSQGRLASFDPCPEDAVLPFCLCSQLPCGVFRVTMTWVSIQAAHAKLDRDTSQLLVDAWVHSLSVAGDEREDAVGNLQLTSHLWLRTPMSCASYAQLCPFLD